MNSKLCKKCNNIKYLFEFSKQKAKNTGLQNYCKSCCKIARNLWAKNNSLKIKEFNKNRDKIKTSNHKNCKNYKKIISEKQQKFNEYTKKYNYNRRRIDIKYKLIYNLRCRLRIALKYNYKNGSAVNDLGCSIDELKIYLESKFQEGMTWENWSRNGWHIDHIIPLSSFDLTDRKQFLKACHYTNLQPLWAIENIRKGNK